MEWLADQDDPAVWEQIAQVRNWNSGTHALSPAQVAELQRRIARLDSNETQTHSWEDVKTYVRQRYHDQS